MSVILSRRFGVAMAFDPLRSLEGEERDRIAAMVDGAESIEDIPPKVASLLLESEANAVRDHEQQERAAHDLLERQEFTNRVTKVLVHKSIRERGARWRQKLAQAADGKTSIDQLSGTYQTALREAGYE